MATLKELRLRIKSLKNTKKITAAMKMVSAAKLKRAKDASESAKPYINNLNQLVSRISSSSEDASSPLLVNREVKRIKYIVFTSDRGLCGGFNNNLVKFFIEQTKNHVGITEFSVSVVGKKAYDQIRKTKLGQAEINLSKYYQGMASKVSFQNAQEITNDVISEFTASKYDKVILIYNRFVSTISQKPKSFQLLPFAAPEAVTAAAASGETNTAAKKTAASVDYIYEPDQNTLLNQILPKHISIQIFQAFLDNAAGEHAARMTAMENATKNASEFIGTLSIKMNRARQAAITTELTEIVSGAESLKS